MANPRKGKELHIITPDEVGMTGKVCAQVADARVNIKALCVYASEGKGHFLMVTDDNAKAQEALKKLNFEVTESDVVLVDAENRVGGAKDVTLKLGDAGIYINYCYITATEAERALAVISTKDNDKAISLLV